MPLQPNQAPPFWDGATEFNEAIASDLEDTINDYLKPEGLTASARCDIYPKSMKIIVKDAHQREVVTAEFGWQDRGQLFAGRPSEPLTQQNVLAFVRHVILGWRSRPEATAKYSPSVVAQGG